MSKKRISTKPTELRDQLTLAVGGIEGEISWPATSPNDGDVHGAIDSITASLASVESLKAQLSQARATLHSQVADGIAIMKRIDEITDGLYGSDCAEKTNFGLSPKKSTRGAATPIEQIVITVISEGTAPASIFVDWDTDAGSAAYQVEWFSDSAMTALVGSSAVSSSEYEIQGLAMCQQYWIRVRGISGNEYGAWSDPATRVANL